MTAYLAFLRSINVGGTKKVAMADLRALAGDLGLANPRTILQSGNLAFESAKKAEVLEKLLETEAKRHLRLDLEFFIRSATEWRAVIAHNPFEQEAEDDPSHLLVMVMKERVTATAVKQLQAAIKGREVVKVWDRHAYVTYPDGIGRSKLTVTMIEKHLGSRGTGRNWNTVLKLSALHEE